MVPDDFLIGWGAMNVKLPFPLYFWLSLLELTFSEHLHAEIVVDDLTQTASKRVSHTHYEYTYQVNIINTSGVVINVSVSVTCK